MDMADDFVKKMADQQRKRQQNGGSTGTAGADDFVREMARKQKARNERNKVGTSAVNSAMEAIGDRAVLDFIEKSFQPTIQTPAQQKQQAQGLFVPMPIGFTGTEVSNRLKAEANNMPLAMQGERSAEVKAEKALMDMGTAEQKVKQLEAQVQQAEQLGAQIMERQGKMEQTYGNLMQLKQAYETTGDLTTGRAYLIAVEQYNADVEAFNKDYAEYQKTAKVYDSYNQAVQDMKKKQMDYDAAYEKWQAEEDAKKPENKSEEDLQKMIADLDSQIERAEKTVDARKRLKEWDNRQEARKKLDQANAELEDLKKQRNYWQGFLEQKQADDWELQLSEEILQYGGSELMTALVNFAKETELGKRFTFDKGVAAAAKTLQDLGVTDEQLQKWMPLAQRLVNEETYNRQTELAKNIAQSSRVAEAAMSLASVPYQLGSGAGILDVTLQKLQQKISGNDTPTDYKRQGMMAYGIADAIRSGVSENIEQRSEGKWGSDTALGNVRVGAYQLLMSMADSLGVVGLTAAGIPGATLLLGGSAATATMMEVKERGGSDAQALTMGYLAGAAETLFEKLSIDNLFDSNKIKSTALKILAQAGTEASEEAATTIANTMADMMVMGDKSQFKMNVREYMEQGMSKEDAEQAAKTDWLAGLLGDIIGGAISGGLFGAGMTVIDKVSDKGKTAMEGQNNEEEQFVERQPSFDGDRVRETAVGSGGSFNQQGRQYAAENERTAETGSRIQSYVDDLRRVGKLDTVDAKAAGIKDAADGSVLEVIPVDAYTSDMKRIAQKAMNLGLETVMTANPIIVNANGKIRTASGFHIDGKIIIQANSKHANAEMVADHEIYHEISEQNPTMVEEARKAFIDSYGKEEFQELYSQYEKLYVDAYAGQNVTSEEVAKRICEEILADAYANRDRYKKGEQYQAAAKRAKTASAQTMQNREKQQGNKQYRNVTAEDLAEYEGQESKQAKDFQNRIDEDATLNRWKRQLQRGEIGPEEYERNVDQYFEQRLRKEIDDLVTAEGSFSFEEDPYTYNALVSKPDMQVVLIDEHEIPTKKKKLDTATIAAAARNKAEVLRNETNKEQRYIWIDDLNANVLVPKSGFAHGIQGNKTNSGTMRTAEVAYDLTDILKNSVAVNELEPKTGEDHDHSYVLFGYAKRKTDGREYVVKSTIHHYGINKSVVDSVEIYDVLKGSKAKTVEPEVIGSHTGMEPAASVLNASGSTTISIAELLETVKNTYPELLPDNVREYFGIQDTKKEPSARYSMDEMDAEEQEAYWNSIMNDPYAEMPQRIRLADKQTMEAWAKENGYPKQNGIQIVPDVTWVKAKGRGNYGRVLGKSENGNFLVMFENRKKGTEAVVEYRADEFEAVQGELQYEGKDIDRENQIATVPVEKPIEEPVQEEEPAPQGDNLTQKIRQTAGGLESFMVAQPQKVQRTLEKKLEFSAEDLAKAMGLENNESLQSIVKRLADEYMELGTISGKTEDQVFDELIAMKEKPEQQTEQEFRAWARADFMDGVEHLMANIKIVRRYIKAQNDAKKAGEETEGKEHDIEDLWQEAKTLRRTVEKTKAKHLLTPEDRLMVGRLLKGYIQIEDVDPRVFNVKGIREVLEASQQYEDVMRMIRAYNTARRAANRAMARELVKDPEKWKDKKRGMSYMTETMERNVEDIAPDEETAKALNDWAFTQVHRNEAAATDLKTQLRNRVRKLELKTGKPKGKNKLSESAAVQLLGEAQDNIKMLEHKPEGERRDGKTLEEWRNEVANIWKESPTLDQKKIENAVKEFREIYDMLFRMMNEARIHNGYEPINYRKGYFPHFQNQEADGVLSAFGKAFGITTEVTNLPATINGMTESFKPGVRWFGHALERLGFQTTLDAVQGFDQYLEGAADMIFHTDDIQRLRALESEIRYQAGTEAIRERADQIRAREDLTDAQKSKEIEELFADAPYALSKFVVEIHEYTNNLANKKSKFDRWFEDMMGRNAYNVMKAMEGRVAANMVALNPGSWLTNFAPLVQGQTSIGDRWILAGMWQENVNFVKKIFKEETDGFAERSTFLTNRRGSERLIKTTTQKVSETLTAPMGWIDNFVSDSLVRAKYMKNLKDGLSMEAAMDDADAWAARIMADRSKGAMPTVFNQKNPITKLFTQYQLEVKNSFSWLLKDLPKEKRKKGIARIAMALLSYAIRAYIFNDLYEFFVGRRPAFDPADLLLNTAGDIWGFDVPNVIDALTGKDRDFEAEKIDAAEMAGNAFTNVVEELPFIGGLIGGGRLPISSALPDWEKLGSAVFAKTDDPDTEEVEGISREQKSKAIFNELIKPGLYIIPPFGGGQAKKVIESVNAFKEHGSYTPSGELRYPVFTSGGISDWETFATGLIFGASSLNEAQAWVESGFENMNERYTNAYRSLIEQGEVDRDAYDLVKTVADAQKTEDESANVVKRNVLNSMEASGAAKLTVYTAVLASDSELELIDQLAKEDAETVYELMNDMYGQKASTKRNIIDASGLSEAGKEKAWMWTKGSSDDSQQSADERLQKAKKYGLYIGDIVELENAGVNMDTVDKLYEAGLSGDASQSLALALRKAEDENGTEKNLNDADRFDVIMSNVKSEQERQKAISATIERKDFQRMLTAKDYVTTGQYQDFLKEFEKTYPGEKINQERAEDVLNGMKVSNDLKAVLWQIATNGKDGKKNPYNDTLGKKIYDLTNQEDENVGGIQWAGKQ